MVNAVKLDKIYSPSSEIIAREIEGEIIIVPLNGGIGDLEDELFTLNETAKAVWEKLVGKKISDVVKELQEEFKGSEEAIKADVIGLVKALLERRILIESTSS